MYVPPQQGRETPPPKQEPKKKGPWAAITAALAAGWKFILPAFKLLKGAKFLLTGLSMLASVWVYSIAFGWPFAAGLVICIFVHEMGHVAVAALQGVPVTVPIFIPGMGALILQKQWAKSAWAEALIGIGGPIGGTIAALFCWGMYYATGHPIFLGLAFFAFFMNLFNMTPIFPLDGGWIVGSISPYLWLVGVVAFAGMALSGMIHNPLIWLLIIMSLPRLWNGLKSGKAFPGALESTPKQKIAMGVAYVGLCCVLAVGMSTTNNMLHLRTEEPTQSEEGSAPAQ